VIRERDRESRRGVKNGGAYIWRGNGGPPEMEGVRGNLKGDAKWRLV
jgi:hypothetical protein